MFLDKKHSRLYIMGIGELLGKAVLSYYHARTVNNTCKFNYTTDRFMEMFSADLF